MSEREPAINRRSSSHRSDGRGRGSEVSRSHRSHRNDHRPRTRRSRSGSRHRSMSKGTRMSSVPTLRERERRLSHERQRLRDLEREVRREREKVSRGDRNDPRVRQVETPRTPPGPSNSCIIDERTGRGRSSLTPAKRTAHSDNDNDRSDSKKRKAMAANLFEEFLNIIKLNTGDRESFASVNNVIPEFDPLSKEQTVNIWLDKVDECSEIYSWSEKRTIHYALPKLTGLAKTWYQGLPSIKHTWVEWKAMLRESFPATENYAELLTDMLNRRVRPGESFELYYFAKINLLNRCKIFGRQAVDCILYGIDDKGVRVGAQAAKFDKPEDVLEFFKTIKFHHKNTADFHKDFNRDKRPNTFSVNNSTRNRDNNNSSKNNNVQSDITCFNCRGVGHPSFKCPKPIVKCTTCNFFGHDASNCVKGTKNPSKDKVVLEVLLTERSSEKYKILININGTDVKAQLDLGSEATLIRRKDAMTIGLEWDSVDGPHLRGLGNVPYLPLGRTYVNIGVQGILETGVEVYIVDDKLINCNVLLGHSFTERPTLKIIKTPTDLKFTRIGNDNGDKILLYTIRDVRVDVGKMVSVPVKSNLSREGNIYVGGSIRGPTGQEYYLLPGEYQINGTECNLLIQNVSTSVIAFKENTLVTRAQFLGPRIDDLRVLLVHNGNLTCDKPLIKCGEQLSDTQKKLCEDLLDRYKNCFSTGMNDLGFTNIAEMEIHLKDSNPVVYRPYRLPHSERKLVQDMIGDMMDNGIVRESNSPYASPIVLVKKKSGEKRLCVDYRALNSRTIRDHYPLPRIDDLLDQLSGHTLFTSLDLASGYHQIAIAENSREKTAFVTPDGQYEYNRVPFGLANAPAVFQRVVHKILSKSKVGYVVIYMDDILIPSKSFEEGLGRLEEVLGLLRGAGLTLKMEKCSFFQERVNFLGFEINKDGIKPGSQKTEAVSKFPTPRNQHEVRRFLGLASFFRRFVKGFALVARPLTNLLKKNISWQWGQAEVQSFETIKKLLSDRPILALYDHNAETQLHTDASKLGVAGILLQRKGTDLWQPVAYFSRQTSADEMKLHSFELETLAVISSLNKFRTYLIGVKFTIVTDCNALRATFTKKDLIPRISRWWIQFLEFDCDIEYRPGERMSHVDALSRGPVEPPVTEDLHTLDILSVKTEDWITTVQSADEEVKRIKEVLENPETSRIANTFKEYVIKNGRVFRILENGDTRWVVPRGVRWHLLKANHNDVGHFGFEKTLERVRSLFWFPKMRKFIKKYVSACLECAHHKLPSGAKEGLLHPIPKVEVPFHTLHADHLGPFPRSRRGYTYILVIVDSFTKYVSITPVRSTKTKESIRAFKNLFSYFGSPSRLITDRGSSFTSKNFKLFMQSIGAKHILNSVATPRANGQVERYNRTILASLSSMAHDKNKNSWDELLPDVQLGINTTVHDVTKKTPSELLFGRIASNPAQGLLNNVIDDIGQINDKTIDEIRSEAGEKIKKNQVANKNRFDKHRKKVTNYKEGDLIRIVRAIVSEPGQSKKLESKCQGPYRIKKILPNDRFLVEDTPLTRRGARYETIVAIDKIFPWLSFSAPTCSSGEDSNDDTDND
ncbi:jg26686 [Pararge aegeria aegeria]|uniref:RNA-directed DNA polymerase n=1 Tax=Pararge aegeria aegeria TaxID=348720 RepID=A0A8S4QX75_9NEOP|nr:jg26686 [Pararge aegeria aegeria]